MGQSILLIPPGFRNRIVAGAAFGHYVGHLLYYLNPQIEPTMSRLLAVTLVYTAIGGLLFGSILWGFRKLRVRFLKAEEELTSGFGWVVFFCFFTTTVYLRHLLTLRIYLPRESVNMLSNATRVIAATTLLLFLLWLAEKIRRLSRWVFVVGYALLILSAFFLFQRRDIYRADEQASVVVDIGSLADHRTVVLVMIDSLSHDWLVTLEGEMSLPWIERARQQGFFSRLQPFPTTNVRTIWASLATGKLPYRHGVTGLYSYQTPLNRPDEPFLLLPRGVSFGNWGLLPPVRKSSAHLPTGGALPVWGIFDRLGLEVVVTNFPASSESERNWRGVISDREITSLAMSSSPSFSISSRPRPTQSQEGDEVDFRLTEDLTAASECIRLFKANRPDFVAVTLGGIRDVYEDLGLRRNDLPDASTPAGGTIRDYVAALDEILARLDEELGDATMILVSPSAPEPRFIPHNTRELIASELFRTNAGEVDGFVLMLGADVRFTTTRESVEVADIVPTLLFAAGLPTGRDMDGRVMTEAFDERFLARTPLTLIQSYEAGRLVIRRPVDE